MGCSSFFKKTLCKYDNWNAIFFYNAPLVVEKDSCSLSFLLLRFFLFRPPRRGFVVGTVGITAAAAAAGADNNKSWGVQKILTIGGWLVVKREQGSPRVSGLITA